MSYAIEPLTHASVDDYVRTHVELTVLTYAHLVGPEFGAGRRGEFAGRVEQAHADIDATADADRAGRPAVRRHLLARNERGGIVAVGASGLGIEPWEVEHFGDAWVPPATEFTLAHLYLVPGAQGTGLGLRLLDALLPDRAAAYLWVFTENARAVAFYRRNGFEFDGLVGDSGASWGQRPLGRMVRPSGAVSPVSGC